MAGAEYLVCRKKLWPLIVLEVLVVLVAQNTVWLEAQSVIAEEWIDWTTTGYCGYDGNKEIKKVFIRRCSLSKFLQDNPDDFGVCGPEDGRFRAEPGDTSCRSNLCVLVLTVGSISGVVLILVTLGIIVYLYMRNPNTDRKLLSENIYDEAVYDVRPVSNSSHRDQRFPDENNKVNSGCGGESIELIENDLYDMEIPSPRTPNDQTDGKRKSGMFNDGDYNIYEAVP